MTRNDWVGLLFVLAVVAVAIALAVFYFDGRREKDLQQQIDQHQRFKTG